MGTKYCNKSKNFLEVDWFFNDLKGSSGKKVSLRDDFSVFRKGFAGGTSTWKRCSISMSAFPIL